MKSITILSCLALVAAARAQSTSAPAPSAGLSNETDASLLAQQSASDFVYAPTLESTPNASASTSSQRMLGQWPALSKQGISQTYFTLGACALRPPHYHLRATGLLYLISGTIQVGFTSEDGKKAYVNNITAGASTFFPQGLVHYQQNLACEPATYLISYNSEDPGTQVSVPGLIGLPSEVAAATLGWTNSPSDYTSFMSTVPTGKFVANSNAECVAQCSTPASASTAGK